MQIKNALSSFMAPRLQTNGEAKNAFDEFLKNIPGRVLQCEIDLTKTAKQGVLQGEKVYKFGSISEKSVIFLEYFENRNQGEPTMALYVDKAKEMFTVKGWQVNKRFYLCYKVVNGRVEKASKLDA